MIVVVKEGVFRVTTDPANQGKVLSSPYASNLTSLRRHCQPVATGQMFQTDDPVWRYAVKIGPRQLGCLFEWLVEEADYNPAASAAAYESAGDPAAVIKWIEEISAENIAKSATSVKK